MVWRREDPQGNESGKIRWELVKWTRGKGLDVGCGPNKAFPHMIGVDNGTDIQLFGHQFKPDVWIDDDVHDRRDERRPEHRELHRQRLR